LKKEGKPGEVVIIPVAIRYAFEGDLNKTLQPTLDELEQRFSWQPRHHQSLVERIDKIGQALLSLKEIEYLGAPREGNPYERAEKLVEETLSKLEDEWNIKDSSGGTIARVKRIRTAILPDLVARRVSQDERERRWRHLAACYYAQQMSHYPRDYIMREKNLPERLVETVERFEEDFTDQVRVNGPFKCTIEVGEPLPVGTQRERVNGPGDPVMLEVRRQLQSMMDGLAAERKPV
jgi:hypothetical protein